MAGADRRLRIGLALAGGVLAIAAVLGTCEAVPSFISGSALIDSGAMRAELAARGSRLVLSTRGDQRSDPRRLPVALRLWDGTAFTPLRLGRPHATADAVVAPVLLTADAKIPAGRLVVARTATTGVARIELTLDSPSASTRELALAIEAPLEGRSVFVAGAGEMADVGAASGDLAIIGEDPAALAVASDGGPVAVSLAPQPSVHVGAPKIVRVTAVPISAAHAQSALYVSLARKTQPLFAAVWTAAGQKVAHVQGVVRGASAKTRLFGVDDAGKPRVRALVDANGRFALDVPSDVNRWYAASDEARTSPPLFFEPGKTWDLLLDVSAGGELTARVRDADGDAPLVARLAVRGIEGTIDPSFGPDYRASGAGPLVDARTGEVTTPLPAGRYRVSASKGIEWSIDAADVTIAPGARAKVDLHLRHVVPTPDEVGCDLHVHARPSFDTPVLPEDRVLSLVAAGVDFAVPTEHNVVGNYGPALEALDLASALAWVPGVEITTDTPRFGHFGVFPMPEDAGPPPYRRTTAARIFAYAHEDPNRVLVVHHPRLPKDIGYFEVAGFDPKSPATFGRIRLDFDALEVYNGYDIEHASRVDEVLADYYALLDAGRHVVATGSSDAHRIQYNWAGYPRTMVRLASQASDAKQPVDGEKVVRSLKRGHATVTSGPVLDVVAHADGTGAEGEHARPGEELRLDGKRGVVDVLVRAAPWVDVTDLDLVTSGGKAFAHVTIPSRPTVTGPEAGTLAEAAGRTVRHMGSFPIPDGTRWIMVVARGARRTDDVLPFMRMIPLAFTNPIWIAR